jgi:hypothetical protein
MQSVPMTTDVVSFQGRIQDLRLVWGALKTIAPSGGRREHFWGISCEKSRFYAKRSYFFHSPGGLRDAFILFLLSSSFFNHFLTYKYNHA